MEDSQKSSSTTDMPLELEVDYGGKQSSTKRKSTKRRKSKKSQLKTQSTTKNKKMKPSSPKKVVGESKSESKSKFKCDSRPYKAHPEVMDYYKTVRESEGFTSVPVVRPAAGLFHGVVGSIFPIDGDTYGAENAARFAIDEQNKKGENIILKGIVKVNGQSLGIRMGFYMTLKTLVGADEKTVFYETKVYKSRSTGGFGGFELGMFREAIHYKPGDFVPRCYEYHECRYFFRRRIWPLYGLLAKNASN